MREVDPTIDISAVVDVLAGQYGYEGLDLDFVPLGADNWCFRAGALWVSARRDREGHVPGAYEAAVELHEQGYDFVLAPLRGADRRVVHHAGRHPVVVSPFRSGETLHAESASDTYAIAAMVSKLHAASVAVRLPREDYRFPFQRELEAGLSIASASDTDAGPYSHRVQQLVRAHRSYLATLMDEAETIAEQCRADASPLVLTHGEPNGNILRGADGHLVLFDWGSLALGPPERDWWDFEGLPAEIGVRPGYRRFYELRWILGEVAEYVWRFVHPHAGDSDDQWMFDELRMYFPSPPAEGEQ
jgi:spectinomycin phosphotransferase